jgi:tetratricopeptide (TPR) repeat protein/type II secretory pathway pseudopilin PulG
MSDPPPSSEEHAPRWPRGWLLAGLMAVGLAAVAVVVLELWPHPPAWLHGPRDLVVDGLHWLRVYWLTSGALGVLVALAALLVPLALRRVDRRRDERARAQQQASDLTQQAERDAAARAALLAAHCWMPRVSDVQDPVTLGVHPAATLKDLAAGTAAAADAARLGLPARVPVYVPRDLDARLDAALAHALASGGLVLLRGDSTAGKSRAAYEALRRLPGELRVLVPHRRGSLRALLDGRVELEGVVVWLNDLERWLGGDGLDAGLLRRLLGRGDRRVLVLATMRASEYAKRSPDRDRDHPDLERDVLRAERELLDQAVHFELLRRFSPAERNRAAERAWDPRIADALAHAGRYGLAEYLAAGPRLWLRWRNARAVDNPDDAQAGAAIVAAALDCRRAGLTRPVPTRLLKELYRDYLEAVVAGRLAAGAFDEGLAWAREPVQATSALVASDEDGEVVFDYLLDRLQADPEAPPVPPRVWERLLADLRPDDGVAVGVAAHTAGQHSFAEQAWHIAADAGDHDAESILGFLLKDQGRLEEAERWWRRAAEAGHHPAESNLGFLLAERGDLEEAERWWRRAAEAGHHLAEFTLWFLLAEHGDLEEAERWWRRAAERGTEEAVQALAHLRADRRDTTAEGR